MACAEVYYHYNIYVTSEKRTKSRRVNKKAKEGTKKEGEDDIYLYVGQSLLMYRHTIISLNLMKFAIRISSPT